MPATLAQAQEARQNIASVAGNRIIIEGTVVAGLSGRTGSGKVVSVGNIDLDKFADLVS